MANYFLPAGFRKLDELAKDLGTENVGSRLAAGQLKAFRINAWGEMFAIEGEVWRSSEARTIVENGKIGGRYLGKPKPDSGDVVVVRMPQPQATAAPASDNLDARTGYAGRPARGRELIEDEFRRRANAALLKTSLRAEAEHLLAWFCRTYPTLPAPTVKTIENNLRDAYRKTRN